MTSNLWNFQFLTLLWRHQTSHLTIFAYLSNMRGSIQTQSQNERNGIVRKCSEQHSKAIDSKITILLKKDSTKPKEWIYTFFGKNLLVSWKIAHKKTTLQVQNHLCMLEISTLCVDWSETLTTPTSSSESIIFSWKLAEMAGNGWKWGQMSYFSSELSSDDHCPIVEQE